MCEFCEVILHCKIDTFNWYSTLGMYNLSIDPLSIVVPAKLNQTPHTCSYICMYTTYKSTTNDSTTYLYYEYIYIHTNNCKCDITETKRRTLLRV